MAVVAAFKLDELVAPSGAARQAQSAHARFGAGADQAHHVHRGHELQNGLGQLNFALGGRTKREAVKRRLLHRFEHGRVAVTQNHRAPRADVVDVLLAIGVPKIGALCALHKTRRAAHGAKSAHRRIHAARDHAAGAFEQSFVQVSVWFHWKEIQKNRRSGACPRRCLRCRRFRAGPRINDRE